MEANRVSPGDLFFDEASKAHCQGLGGSLHLPLQVAWPLAGRLLAMPSPSGWATSPPHWSSGFVGLSFPCLFRGAIAFPCLYPAIFPMYTSLAVKPRRFWRAARLDELFSSPPLSSFPRRRSRTRRTGAHPALDGSRLHGGYAYRTFRYGARRRAQSSRHNQRVRP
jgi:hypothetical protein